jgi:hypothetical protein
MRARKGYKEAAAKAVRINGEIDLESLPPQYRAYIAKQRKYHKKYRRVHPSVRLDKQIYLNKYYPWCYKDYKPTLVLQGWYDYKQAKKKYYLTYGPDALKYVRFVRGDQAIARKFAIGKNLFINGRWRIVRNKVMRPKYRSLGSEQARLYKDLKNKSSRDKEKIMHKRWDKYRYGEQYIEETSRETGIKLSAIQEANEKRKDYLYELPEGASDQTLSPEIQEYYKDKLR